MGRSLADHLSRDMRASWLGQHIAVDIPIGRIVGNALVAAPTARALSAEGLAVAGGPETMAGTVALINLAYIANVERRHRDAERLGRRALHASLRRGDRVAAVWTAWPWAGHSRSRVT